MIRAVRAISRPSSTGLSESLAPLAPFRSQISVVAGMDLRSRVGGADLHETGTPTVLTGGNGPNRNFSSVQVPSGRSIDRVIGRQFQGSAAYASYEIGVRTHVEGVQSKRRVSYDGNGGGRDAVTNPQRAFDDLLAAVDLGQPMPSMDDSRRRRLVHQGSVLDAVRGDLQRLHCRVGIDGREKFESHIESIRAVETRLQRMAAETPMNDNVMIPTVPIEGRHGDRSFWDSRDRFPEVGLLQMQIMRTALAAGVSNVITMHWAQSVSRQNYPWIPGMNYPNEGQHAISHPNVDGLNEGRAFEDQTKIAHWYAEQLHTFLSMLSDVPEGDGTLLDHTLVLRVSEMAHGNHGSQNMPFLYAGMGDRFRLGRNFNAGGRPHNDLLSGVLQGFDIPADRFGEDRHNTGPYRDILV